MVSDEEYRHFFPDWDDWDVHLCNRKPKGNDLWYYCDRCGRIFHRWLVSDNSWKKAGFGKGAAVCKSCFEERIPKPRYYSAEKYWSGVYDCREFELKEPKVEWVKKRVAETEADWNGEPEPEPPKLSNEELEEKLLRGECGQAYARTQDDVELICLFCTAKGCKGPFRFGNWEERYPEDVAAAERRQQWKLSRKPDHLHLGCE